MNTVFCRCIQLADEWGSSLMEAVATTALRDPAHADKQPLIVRVQEHGGWSLGFTLLEGEVAVVYSANDAAVFHGPAREFREAAYRAAWHYLPMINRNDPARRKEEPDEDRPAA
jgi:hypothetical protein